MEVLLYKTHTKNPETDGRERDRNIRSEKTKKEKQGWLIKIEKQGWLIKISAI